CALPIFPDRNTVLHFIDDVTTGCKRFRPMPRADAHPDGQIADRKRADAMHARRFHDAETADRFVHDALAFLARERLEGFVLQTRDFEALVVIADPAFERRVAARRRILELDAQ